jgi:hypothetical protein
MDNKQWTNADTEAIRAELKACDGREFLQLGIYNTMMLVYQALDRLDKTEATLAEVETFATKFEASGRAARGLGMVLQAEAIEPEAAKLRAILSGAG